MLYHNLIDAIGNTPLVEMPRMSPKASVKLYAKLEGQNPSGSVKDRIAKYMIEEAERTGVLTKDRVVLEPTSGNTGISLAMICRIKGYRLKVVIPESVSAERTELLTAFGAEIVYSDGVRGTNGSIEVANADRGGGSDVLHAVPVRQRDEPARALRDDGPGDPARPAGDRRVRRRAWGRAAR